MLSIQSMSACRGEHLFAGDAAPPPLAKRPADEDDTDGHQQRKRACMMPPPRLLLCTSPNAAGAATSTNSFGSFEFPALGYVTPRPVASTASSGGSRSAEGELRPSLMTHQRRTSEISFGAQPYLARSPCYQEPPSADISLHAEPRLIVGAAHVAGPKGRRGVPPAARLARNAGKRSRDVLDA